MRKLLPLLLTLAGLLAGSGAGYLLRPAPAAEAAPAHGAPAEDQAGDHAGDPGEAGSGHGEPAAAPAKGAHAAPAKTSAPAAEHGAASGHGGAETAGMPDYVKLSNQFVVPVVEEGRVAAMVILSLSLEVPAGTAETVFAREPKLRDVFLQVLFDHANAGGFRGAFTDGANLKLLRRALFEVASGVLGDLVSDVLIVDIVRQDS
jgi:hypothetical protein